MQARGPGSWTHKGVRHNLGGVVAHLFTGIRRQGALVTLRLRLTI